MRRTLIAAAVVSVFLFAGLSVVVEAKDPADRPSKEERQQKAQEMREQQMEKRREALKSKFFDGNATLSLSGAGIARDNETFTFTLEAAGKARGKLTKDNETHGYRGVLGAHGVVTDSNGTVVKEGDFRVKLLIHPAENGTWVWKVVSFAQRSNGMPRVVLRGEAEMTAEGAFELSGAGHMVVRMEEKARATPIKMTEVSGSATVPVKAA